MTGQQKKWFEELVNIRTYLADALDFSAVTGVPDTVVEKYIDQAHFIYELLQNADYAKATNISVDTVSNCKLWLLAKRYIH